MIRSLSSIPDGTPVTVEPRADSKTYLKYKWPLPAVTKVVANEIVLPNKTGNIIPVKKNEHICQIRPMTVQEIPSISVSQPLTKNRNNSPAVTVKYKLNEIVVDPNHQLDEIWKLKFDKLHELKKAAFADKIGRYNDNSGKVRARVNIGNAKCPQGKLTYQITAQNQCISSKINLTSWSSKVCSLVPRT